jgi:hypothetical protein
VAAMRRRRRHLAARWPPRPTRSLTPAAPRPSSSTPSHLPPHRASDSRARVGEPPPPPARVRSSELPVPAALAHRQPPSCSELRLSLAQSALASSSRGKLPLRGNCSPKFQPSSPENTATWTPTLRSPFFLLHGRISFALLPRCSCASPCAVSWPEVTSHR